MLSLMPQLVVTTATTLASWERPRDARDADADRELTDETRGDTSLRFVDFVGFWSHFSHEAECSSWPLPMRASLEELAGFAEAQCGLVSSPLAGDVFLFASANADRHVSAGIIAGVENVIRMLNGSLAFVCTTIEGEFEVTTDDLGAGGGQTYVRPPTARLVRRRLAPVFGDCFIRWSELAPRTSRATIQYDEPKHLVTIDRARWHTAA